MDLSELFSGETTIKIKFKGVVTHHVFREPTHQEDMEYRRNSTSVRARNGKAQGSQESINAPLVLYHQICTAVLIENGNGKPEAIADEFRKQMPDRLKLEAIATFLGDTERAESDTLGNS